MKNENNAGTENITEMELQKNRADCGCYVATASAADFMQNRNLVKINYQHK